MTPQNKTKKVSPKSKVYLTALPATIFYYICFIERCNDLQQILQSYFFMHVIQLILVIAGTEQATTEYASIPIAI